MDTSLLSRWNLDAVEMAYAQWRRDPGSVDETWLIFFQGFELGCERRHSIVPNVIRLVDAYRNLGHFLANLDPLNEPRTPLSLLELDEFGLNDGDLNEPIDGALVPTLFPSKREGKTGGTLHELLSALRETYCRTVGVEYMHVENPRIRQWLQTRMEPCRNEPGLSQERKLHLLHKLHEAELFEKFLHTSYVGQKRFSLEGAETLIAVLDALVERAANNGVREIVLGMAHRGRLNVMANILGKPFSEIFSEFEDHFTPLATGGDGDVKYHLGFSSDRTSAQGNRVHLSLSPNPSHLEAINPVALGRTRAKQQRFGDPEGMLGMAVLIHGDAALAGQGSVAETLNLSQLAGFRTGGTIHLVVNNQIGFTTSPADARSTTYCTDVAKMLDVPIFHVNAEDPETAVFLVELAFDFRHSFHSDVVIDLVCYRRHGHNEGDEPFFTQPLMYAKIKDRPSVTQVYTDRLISKGDLTREKSEAIDKEFQDKLQTARNEVQRDSQKGGAQRSKAYAGHWKGLTPHYSSEIVKTGIPRDTLSKIVAGILRLPDWFNAHPKFVRYLKKRQQRLKQTNPWTGL
jgi:2-oxoglutarate dehydrogenase E1 component